MRLLCLLLIVFVSACSVSPDYVPPTPPSTTQYLPGAKNLNVQNSNAKISESPKIAREWWKLFANAELNSLVQQAIKNNYNVEIAQKNLAQATEAVKAKRGALWPQLGLAATVGNQLFGVAAFGPADIHIPVFNYYELGPTVAWDLDLFGVTRYAVEQQKALVDYQEHNLNAVYLLLISNVVTQALEIAAVREEIQKTAKIIAVSEKTLQLLTAKFKLGSGTRIEMLTAQNRLNNDRLQLPILQQRLNVAQHALAILVGNAPGDWSAPNFNFTNFNLPAEIPLSLPSQLVRQRPDILAAEANLHAMHALVGVTTASLYPNIVINANLLQEALNLKTLFNSANTAWSVAANLTAPLFNGGALCAEKRKAEHAYKGALAQYQQTILVAFKQVADALTALQHDAATIKLWQQNAGTMRELLSLTEKSFAAGASNLLQLQDVRRDLDQAELNLIRAELQQYLNTMQLLVVLGGTTIS